MQPVLPTYGVLSLIALLAPLPAAAFGDLDCIAIEACVSLSGETECTPASDPFAVTFDWANDAATLRFSDIDHRLIWLSTGDWEDQMSTVIEYSDIDGTDRALSIVANGADISAYYSTYEQSGTTTWVGICDIRRAT